MKKENINLIFGKHFEWASYSLITGLKMCFSGIPQAFSKYLKRSENSICINDDDGEVDNENYCGGDEVMLKI